MQRGSQLRSTSTHWVPAQASLGVVFYPSATLARVGPTTPTRA